MIMAIRKVRTEEDDVLRIKCKKVAEINRGTRQLIGDMFETMYATNGVGLAAPQIGVVKRIVVIDDTVGHKMALINPEFTLKEGEQDSDEGCLSLPGFRGKVKRPYKVQVKAFDENAEPVTIDAEGFLAVILCHEIDHLDGILYKDVAYLYEPIPPEEKE